MRFSNMTMEDIKGYFCDNGSDKIIIRRCSITHEVHRLYLRGDTTSFVDIYPADNTVLVREHSLNRKYRKGFLFDSEVPYRYVSISDVPGPVLYEFFMSFDFIDSYIILHNLS